MLIVIASIAFQLSAGLPAMIAQRFVTAVS
jgi:hypothetical protein